VQNTDTAGVLPGLDRQWIIVNQNACGSRISRFFVTAADYGIIFKSVPEFPTNPEPFASRAVREYFCIAGGRCRENSQKSV